MFNDRHLHTPGQPEPGATARTARCVPAGDKPVSRSGRRLRHDSGMPGAERPLRTMDCTPRSIADIGCTIKRWPRSGDKWWRAAIAAESR